MCSYARPGFDKLDVVLMILFDLAASPRESGSLKNTSHYFFCTEAGIGFGSKRDRHDGR